MNENYQLYHGDCLEIMQQLIEEDVKVDMILTDLPYGTIRCKWDSVIPFEPMWECINQLTKEDTSPILLFGNQPFTANVITSNIQGFKYCWVWNKKIPSGMNYAKYRPMQQTEEVMVFTKNGGKSKYNPQMQKRDKPIRGGGMGKSDTARTENHIPLKKTYEYKNPTTLITFDKIRRGSFHPAQKPTKLLEYLVKTYTDEGDVVLDFTMGSGSTGVACMNLNRKFIGIELEEKYYNIATERLKEATQSKQTTLI